MIEHQSLINYLSNSKTKYINDAEGGSGSFIHLSYTFDASLTGLFMPLLSGKYLVIGSGAGADVFRDENLEKYAPYDFIKITPSHIGLLPAAFKSSNGSWLSGKLVIGGEALRLGQFNSLINEGVDVEVINEYGPTEATVGCSTYSFSTLGVHEFTQNEVPIGKPISNTQIYILSGDKGLSPVGVSGEICIGGAGLARGYLNRAELTEEKFIKDPFSKKAGAKLYKTGDLGRWLPDGNIEYLGRMDDQVKIEREYRIELGEIESVLNGSGLVQQGVVLAKGDSGDNNRLIGYVVPQGTFDKQAMQNYLGTKLPEYMVPSLWVELESMPLTANGKIDKKALPDPELTDMVKEYVAPRNATEAKLAEIWQELLEVERIGINDDFFELGGHSLLGIRVVSSIRTGFGLELPINDLFDYPTIALLAGRLADGPSLDLLPPLVKISPRPQNIPLSFSQERLWFLDRLDGSLQYHVRAVLRLHGELIPEALEQALRTIIERHEVLRTVVGDDDGRGYQHILEADNWSLRITEGLAGVEAGLSQYIEGLVSKPFDLSADYMLRVELIKLDEQEHIMVVTMHHIASDGWSASILVNEVIALYEGYISGSEANLPVLPIQYADYAIWQRSYMQGEVLEERLGYWKAKLEGVAPLLLPLDYARPPIQSSRGAARSFVLDPALSAELVTLSHQYGATLYMTMLAAFKVLLYRYSSQEDICVGTPVAGRNQRELEGLIGFFVNTLALRSQLKGNMTFIELLHEIKAMTLEAYAHQEVPFETVVDAVVKERDMSRNPLFQVMFGLQNTPEIPELKLGELSLSVEAHEHSTSKFDIAFLIKETSSGIHGTVEYCIDLYREETISRMLNHYINLLQSIAASPQEQIGYLAMLSGAEEEQLLVGFNVTQTDYVTEKSVVELFEDHAGSNPGSLAVVFEDQELSYGELNERSNQLAHYLQKQGVKPGTLVPVCIERGLEMVVGILGILKAGGAYVPVDPSYPADRISYMLEDTGAKLVLSSKAGREKLNGTASIIELDGDWGLISGEAAENINVKILPEQLAYVIYTSGSTGQPKGVMIEHQSLINYLSNSKTRYINDAEGGSGSFIHLSYTFDASLTGLFMPLLSGKYLVIGSGAGADVFRDENLEKYAPYDFIKITPSHIGLLPAAFKSSNGSWLSGKLVIGGEALRLGQFNSLINEGIDVEVINEYGPTEATVGCSTYSFSTLGPQEFTQNEVPIGKPISNTQIYILSGDKGLSPVGVSGEICIGGAGLARGYLNRPELTSEKFIKDPFSKKAGARLYKTGDLGRWLPDGNIEYLGRMDDQVKIRGYRIELGEIESVLNGSGQVQQGVVLAKADSGGNKRLVGYAVPQGTFDKQAVQNYLGTKLPEYMVPSLWVELESMPLTANGKIDKKALPDPELTEMAKEYVAPRNATEAKLAEIWQEVLGVELIGIHDDFFELGGHSLLAIRLVSYIKRDLSVSIPIQTLFRFTSIGDQSKYLDFELQNAGNVDERNTDEFDLIDL